MKRLLYIIPLLFIITLPSCEALNTISQTSGTKLVKKTQKAKYLITNGVKIIQVQSSIDTPKGKTNYLLPIISGLNNKRLEDKINEEIKLDVAYELREYMSEFKDAPDYIFCQTDVNSNNLLAINMYSYNSTPVGGTLYDLVSGRRLYLGDIFTRGTDYVTLLNEMVTLGILSGNVGEEDLLREPFTSIKTNQSFALTESTLYVVFRANECGFAARNAIGIPLSKIDDYVDVFDRAFEKSDTNEAELYQFPSIMIKNNNIFTDLKGSIFKRNNGKVMAFYPVISGGLNSDFEKIVNNTIVEKINEIVNSKNLNYRVTPDRPDDQIGVIEMNVVFNSFGILSILCYGFDRYGERELEPYNVVHSFDLINNKPIDAKDIINRYRDKNLTFEKTFTDYALKSLVIQNSFIDKKSIKKLHSNINYSYIMKNALLYFSIFDSPGNVQVSMQFKKDVAKGIPYSLYCCFPLKGIIKIPTEDFFKLNN